MPSHCHNTLAQQKSPIIQYNLVVHLMWQVERGSLSSFPALYAHQERHRGIEEMIYGSRNNRQIDVLPLEGEEQSGDALGHCHQFLVILEQRGK